MDRGPLGTRAASWLALAVLLQACGGVGKTIRRGDRYMEDGRHTAAARTYTVALEKRPRDPELLSSVARAWLDAGEPLKALSPARLAVHAEAVGAEALLAEALISTGKSDEALPLLAAAEQVGSKGDEEVARLHFLWAEAALATGDIPLAVTQVETALPHNSSPRGTTFAGWVHARAGNLDRAVMLVSRVTDHADADAQVYAEAAAIHRLAEDVDSASELASRARTLTRDEPDAWALSASQREEAGDREGALRRASWLRALNPDDGVFALQLGELWASAGEPKRSLDELASARTLSPMQSLFETGGSVKVADVRSRSLTDQDRIELMTRYALAESESWRLLGDARKSVEARVRALKLAGSSAPAEEWLVVAETWLAQQDFEATADAAEQAVAIDARSVRGWLLLLRAHAALGEVDQAIGYGRKAWDLSRGNPDVAMLLADLYMYRGDVLEARKLLGSAMKLHPDDRRLAEALVKVQGG